eukprot:TRINITY_DN39666_c0_g2_i1.p1 TRINITY_DN39666_c0_g2~~TRINITY_DN39666_c0_g2_i1.p1  ORF type:complete len:412 (-),score=83.09 TRINITY_DN39666_c0_g2_i1:20-1255(-)
MATALSKSPAKEGSKSASEKAAAPVGALKKGYLIWDAGFLRQFSASLLVLLLIIFGCARHPDISAYIWDAYQEMLFVLMDGASRMAWWSVIGLLSSSCCALQLLLNAFNFGCAGFNTVLGPVRPTICAMTVCIQGGVWFTALDKPFQWLYVAPCTALAIFLTVLPEITYYWVQRASKGTAAELSQSLCGEKSKMTLSIGGMGCVACTKKISEVVLASGKPVISVDVSVENKAATIALAMERKEAEMLVPDFVSRIKDAGFEAALSSLDAMAAVEQAPAAASEGRSAEVEPAPYCCGGGSSGMLLSISAGLLSSSCCLIQLGVNLLSALNVAHVGCAGLNKTLGPWRWHLRAATAVWLAASWLHCAWKSWRRSTIVRLVFQTSLCVVLTLLPEVLVWSGGPALLQVGRGLIT